MGYVFDPEKLHEISKLGVGLPIEETFKVVTEALKKEYPEHIHPQSDWMFNTANGAMGQLTFLHGSLSEYIIFFGTPIGTEGHSGRYFADVHDYMMAGEMWTYHEGELEKTIYKPGDWAVLERGRTKGYKVPEYGWMMEYSRGWIPTMLPEGVADNLFSNLDFRSMFKMFWTYGKLILKELSIGKI